MSNIFITAKKKPRYKCRRCGKTNITVTNEFDNIPGVDPSTNNIYTCNDCGYHGRPQSLQSASKNIFLKKSEFGIAENKASDKPSVENDPAIIKRTNKKKERNPLHENLIPSSESIRSLAKFNDFDVLYIDNNGDKIEPQPYIIGSIPTKDVPSVFGHDANEFFVDKDGNLYIEESFIYTGNGQKIMQRKLIPGKVDVSTMMYQTAKKHNIFIRQSQNNDKTIKSNHPNIQKFIDSILEYDIDEQTMKQFKDFILELESMEDQVENDMANHIPMDQASKGWTTIDDNGKDYYRKTSDWYQYVSSSFDKKPKNVLVNTKHQSPYINSNPPDQNYIDESDTSTKPGFYTEFSQYDMEYADWISRHLKKIVPHNYFEKKYFKMRYNSDYVYEYIGNSFSYNGFSIKKGDKISPKKKDSVYYNWYHANYDKSKGEYVKMQSNNNIFVKKQATLKQSKTNPFTKQARTWELSDSQKDDDKATSSETGVSMITPVFENKNAPDSQNGEIWKTYNWHTTFAPTDRLEYRHSPDPKEFIPGYKEWFDREVDKYYDGWVSDHITNSGGKMIGSNTEKTLNLDDGQRALDVNDYNIEHYLPNRHEYVSVEANGKSYLAKKANLDYLYANSSKLSDNDFNFIIGHILSVFNDEEKQNVIEALSNAFKKSNEKVACSCDKKKILKSASNEEYWFRSAPLV